MRGVGMNLMASCYAGDRRRGTPQVVTVGANNLRSLPGSIDDCEDKRTFGAARAMAPWIALRYRRGMTDDVQKLRDTLTRLQADVDAAETRDPEVRVMLGAALQRISAKLEAHPGGTAVAVTSPDTGDLTLAAQKFEAEHPTLAATLRGVVDSLSTMGI